MAIYYLDELLDYLASPCAHTRGLGSATKLGIKACVACKELLLLLPLLSTGRSLLGLLCQTGRKNANLGVRKGESKTLLARNAGLEAFFTLGR